MNFFLFRHQLNNSATKMKIKLDVCETFLFNNSNERGFSWLCIKVGRGQGDGDIGTRVWGLGTWGREGRDVGTSGMGRGTYGTRGRGDVWDGDAGTSNVGDAGGKVGGKRDISFFVKLLFNHIGHLMMFTQNISSYRSRRTDYLD